MSVDLDTTSQRLRTLFVGLGRLTLIVIGVAALFVSLIDVTFGLADVSDAPSDILWLSFWAALSFGIATFLINGAIEREFRVSWLVVPAAVMGIAVAALGFFK